MAKLFDVNIIETLEKIVEVEAEDWQGAIEKVKEMYASEEVILYPEDITSVEFYLN